MRGRPPRVGLVFLLILPIFAACEGKVTERRIAINLALECTPERISLMKSIAIAALGSDQGDVCLETVTCVNVAPVSTAEELEAALAAAPQPLLDLETGPSLQIVVAGYLVPDCPLANEVRACGATYLTPDDTGDLAFTLHCEFIGSTDTCDPFDTRPRTCP